jgi:transcriptional regulator with XRE-family HTH domain
MKADSKTSKAVGVTSEAEADAIGPRLRSLRNEHRYSIRKLSGLAGVSASLISEVERGNVEPSISILKRLATALDTTLAYFFTEQVQQGRVLRSDERRRLDSHGSSGGIVFELLAPDELAPIEPVYGRYEVGASMGEEPVTHQGVEWGIVLKGRLKVMLEGEVYFLEPGDSIWFPSTTPHRLANVADEPTEYIWVNSLKTF